MLTITKEFHLSAGHIPDRLPSRRPRARPHGHDSVVVLELISRRERLTGAGHPVARHRPRGKVRDDATALHRSLTWSPVVLDGPAGCPASTRAPAARPKRQPPTYQLNPPLLAATTRSTSHSTTSTMPRTMPALAMPAPFPTPA